MTFLGICFNGAAHGVTVHEDPVLVVLSYVVAVLASYIALEIAERLRSSRGFARALWHIAAAVALGGGVWSMHFVGMLALRISLRHTYDPVQTVLSGLVAIGAVAGGLQIIRTKASWRRIAGAGLLVGLGIATMHYAGAAALRFQGAIYYKPALFALSLVIAVGAATAALWLTSVLRAHWQRAAAALVMALAVCGMHYTGMAATEFVAEPARLVAINDGVEADVMAGLVAAGVALLFSLGFVSAFLERRRTEQRLRDAIDVMPAALGFYDADDRLVAWNGVYASFFEDPAALRAGQRFVDLLRGPLGESELAALLVIRRQLGVVERQLPDGRWMRIESRRTADGGVVSIGADISALKAQAAALESARDAAEAASRAKSTFLATMGHELRTPLNGVLGMVQALGADALTEPQRQQVEVIRQSSESLLAILGDLLDFTQMGAGTLIADDREFDLDAALRGPVGACGLAAAAKGLAFSYDITEAAHGRYSGDSARIRRIVHNLLDNAVKFTDRGSVRLSVDASGGQVRFEVVDTGIGVAEQDLDRLFEPFFQADAGLSRRHGGAGVGLGVSEQLARLLGGRIAVRSRTGEGATFTLELPMAPLECAATGSGQEVESGPSAEGLQVLVAEDNPVNQLVLRTLLGAIGVEPVLVDDGEAAVAAWAEQPWDIVLMDIQMPKMNGVEATRAIRDREAQEHRARTPIVAVTANSMAHETLAYLAAGMDAVVAKPVDMAVLLAAMDQALQVASSQAA